MSDDRLDDIHAGVNELRVALPIMFKQIESQDVRLRSVEIAGAQQIVKVERLQSDVDGLGRKVRGIAERAAIKPEKEQKENLGWWVKFLRLAVDLPEYWHIISVGFACIGFVLGFVLRYKK